MQSNFLASVDLIQYHTVEAHSTLGLTSVIYFLVKAITLVLLMFNFINGIYMFIKYLMSSANKYFECLITLQKSLINILKSKGPTTDPCGTPERK